MKHLIHKRSAPGWTKEFPTSDDARTELLAHICGDCLNGDHPIVGSTDRHVVDKPNPALINDLLGTPCGCEFEYEVPTDFLTLYCVRHPKDKMIALVVARNGADAISVCVEDGLAWAMKSCQVQRVHKRVSETRGMIDVIETAGGPGNWRGNVRQFRQGVQTEKPQRQL